MAIPGFGGFGAFDFGVATSMVRRPGSREDALQELLEGLVADGDYVGISKQVSFT